MVKNGGQIGVKMEIVINPMDVIMMISPEFERIITVLIGAAIFVHFILMSGFCQQKCSNIAGTFLVLICASATGMIAFSLAGQLDSMRTFTMAAGGLMVVFWIWLWYKGLHISEFVKSLQ